jgi:hypothetical protein
MVRFWRSTCEVQTRLGSGLPMAGPPPWKRLQRENSGARHLSHPRRLAGTAFPHLLHTPIKHPIGAVMPYNRTIPSTSEQPFSRWFLGNIFSIVRRHGNFAAACFTVGYCVHNASVGVQAFAGRTSLANLQLGFLANISIVWSISLAVSGLSIGLYLRERRLHQTTRERLAGRITELELAIDPARESSKLTSRGLTRKEDE